MSQESLDRLSKVEYTIHVMRKQRIALTLTAKAISFLNTEAERKGVSKSVIVELLIREKKQAQNMRGLPGELE